MKTTNPLRKAHRWDLFHDPECEAVYLFLGVFPNGTAGKGRLGVGEIALALRLREVTFGEKVTLTWFTATRGRMDNVSGWHRVDV